MADDAVYRRVTRQCAKDDWPHCRTHAEVAKRHGTTELFKKFLSSDPETWYIGDAVRERRRDVKKKQKAPSARVIGGLKTETHRAWAWHDDGSVYGITAGFPGFELHWMIAYGNRREGHRSDLQLKRQDLLEDPDDNWRPSDADYEELLGEHDRGFTERAVAAVTAAVESAGQQHNTVIDIESPELEGDVLQEHEHDEPDDTVEGAVIAEINELWVLLAKERAGGRALTYTDALTIAGQAYPDGVYPVTVQEPHSIRGGLLNANPSTHYVFYSDEV
jgi:hypothetical protein